MRAGAAESALYVSLRMTVLHARQLEHGKTHLLLCLHSPGGVVLEMPCCYGLKGHAPAAELPGALR